MNIAISEAKPPTWSQTLQTYKKSIPEELFQPSLVLSISYFFWDYAWIIGLAMAKWQLNSLWFEPVYWFLQGTFFWALFVVGHDCGHGSFSGSRRINDFFGTLAHTILLVPYHGWRVSHRTHHNFHGNIDKDESWYPVSKSEYEKMSSVSKFLRFKVFLIVFPLYLFVRSPGRDGSHFHPESPLFSKGDRYKVVASSFFWGLWFVALTLFGLNFGFWNLFTYYIAPYSVFVVWLSVVTYLHHTAPEVPWYRGKSWDYVKGALSTVDRTYGIFEPIHHNIGTHTVHHLFPKIPHYNLLSANAHLKEIVPDLKFESKSVLKAVLNSSANCKFVSDEGETVFYQGDR